MSYTSSSDVKLDNNKYVQLKGLTQNDWINACERLGLCVSKSSGKGSHCAVYKNNKCDPALADCLVITVPRNLYPEIQKKMLKQLIYHVVNDKLATEEEIWKAFKIK